MKNRKVARRYNQALYDIALETGAADKILSDFTDIQRTIAGSKELENFLATPLIGPAKKAEVIRALFTGKISELTLDFLLLVSEKGRVSDLVTITEDFLDLVNQERGVVTAKVRTAVEVTDKERDTISRKLSQYVGKDVSAVYSVDPSIRGGFVAKVGDRIIDASIKRQLELLRERFTEGSFNN
jgi:F-type H+-transporting ATPase subunit delta